MRTCMYLAIAAVAALPVAAQPISMNQTHLAALDKNADGAVSKEEFDQFSDFAFEKMDRNRDSVLAPDEVDKHLIGDAFAMMDGNGDGTVSEDEFMLRMSADFMTADKDGDGLLN